MLMLLFLFALFRHLQGAPLTADEGGVANLSPSVRILPRAHVVFVTRTTSEIVISCVATIFACTWTAIHPNIPSPADSRWNIFKRRLVTTIYALLAPEFITAWAFRQYVGAKRIMEEYNAEIPEQAEKQPDSKQLPYFQRLWGGFKKWLSCPSSCDQIPGEIGQHFNQQRGSHQSIFQKLWLGWKKFGVGVEKWLFSAPPFYRAKKGEIQPWTTTHGFFIQMGGFMLCENGRPIQTLDFSDIKEKIHAGIIGAPRITQAEIEDRGKGDIISKTIVVLQTTWFIAQCIARWSRRIPVTELEIITLAFAMLNGITYALWWNKPQNVGVPVCLDIRVPLTDSLDTDLAASKSSVVSAHGKVSLMESDPLNTGSGNSQTELAIELQIVIKATQCSYIRVPLTDSLDTDLAASKSSVVSAHGKVSSMDDPLNTGSSTNSQTESAIEPQIIIKATQSSHTIAELEPQVTEDLIDAKLHKQSFLSQGLEEDRNQFNGVQLLFRICYRLGESVIHPCAKLVNSDFSHVCQGDLRVGIFFADVDLNSNILIFTIALVAALFGCVHLVPSFFLHYPSPVEMWLWRIFAAFITVQPPLAALIAYVTFMMDFSLPFWANLIIDTFLPVYALSRLALITLAFVSLRDLPPHAHLTINWISSIPHL